MNPGPIFTTNTSSTVTCLLAANHQHLPHHTFNPLLQQTGEPYNLTIRWGKVLSLCCAGFHVACNTFETFPSSYWFDNLGFLLREDLLLCSLHLALGVSNEALPRQHCAPSPRATGPPIPVPFPFSSSPLPS